MPEAQTRSVGSRELSCSGYLKSEQLKGRSCSVRPGATQTKKGAGGWVSEERRRDGAMIEKARSGNEVKIQERRIAQDDRVVWLTSLGQTSGETRRKTLGK